MKREVDRIEFKFNDGTVKILFGSMARNWLGEIHELMKRNPIIDWRKFRWETTTINELVDNEKSLIEYSKKQKKQLDVCMKIIEELKMELKEKENEKNNFIKFPTLDIFGDNISS